MNDPRRTQQFGPPAPGSGSTWAQDRGDSPVLDYPAYADEMPYATYGGGVRNGRRRLPAQPHPAVAAQYWQQDRPPTDEQPSESPPPPRVAAVAVVGGRRRRAAGHRIGRSAGLRQRSSQTADRDRALTAHARAQHHLRAPEHQDSPAAHDSQAAAHHDDRTESHPTDRGAPYPGTQCPGRCRPWSTASAARAGPSASCIWIPATSSRPSSTWPCRGASRSACRRRPLIRRASRSSTSATMSPARSRWPGSRCASATGQGLTICDAPL